MPLQHGEAFGTLNPYQPDIIKPNAITVGGTQGGAGSLSIDPKLYDPIPIPDLPAQPTPSFIDDARVSQLTQQYASPAIRSARNALREALTGRYSNPIQQKFKARGALEGFGEAVERGVASGRPGAINVAMREAEEAGAYDKKAYDLAWQRSLLDYNQRLNIQNMKIREAMAQKALDAQKAFDANMPTVTGGGGGRGGGQRFNPNFQRGFQSFGGGDGTPFGTTEYQRQNIAMERLGLENYARDNSGPWVYVEGAGWRRSGGISPQLMDRWTNEGRILGEYPQPGASKKPTTTGVRISNVTTGVYPIDPNAGLQYPMKSPPRYDFDLPTSRSVTMPFGDYADNKLRK